MGCGLLDVVRASGLRLEVEFLAVRGTYSYWFLVRNKGIRSLHTILYHEV